MVRFKPTTLQKCIIILGIFYIFCHICHTSYMIFQVNDARERFENLKDGPLLLKPGRLWQRKRGNLIEAIGYGNLMALDENKKNNKKRLQKHNKNRKNSQIPKLENSTISKFVNFAHNLQNSSDFLYFTMVNKAYEKMTMNWICNTVLMEKVHQRVLIASLDQDVCDKISRNWNSTINCFSLNITNYDEAYEWGNQGYVNLLTLRVQLMKYLTKAKITYVLFETDAIWFKDPYQLFIDRIQTNNGTDIIVPIKGYENGKLDRLAFNPMIVLPTNRTMSFLEEMTFRLQKNSNLFDQDLMNQYCATTNKTSLKCDEFDYTDVADGKWFKERSQYQLTPYIVNNNFNSGVRGKESKLSLNGFWFLGTKLNKCLVEKVQKFSQRYS